MSTLTFETTTCPRCAGTGTMPFSAYGGKCFKCHGHRVVLTPAGRAAKKLHDELFEAACEKVQAWEVEVGQVVTYAGQVRSFFTVVDKDFAQSGAVIDGHAASAVLTGKNGTMHMAYPTTEMLVRPSVEVRIAIVTEVARRRKGATLAA